VNPKKHKGAYSKRPPIKKRGNHEKCKGAHQEDI
jgi:hypothetical protein